AHGFGMDGRASGTHRHGHSRRHPQEGRGMRSTTVTTDRLERRSRIVGNGDIDVSFEFFPPKTERMEEALWASIRRLAPLGPSFVSVTYGAGGSTRERTHNTVARLARETSLRSAAHLTCVNASRDEINEVVRDYAS